MLSAILESAVDHAILTTGLDRRITFWSAGAAQVLGWSETEMLGRPVDVLFTPEDCAEDLPRLEAQRALEQGRSADERWHLRRDGSRFWALGQMMPLKANGEIIGFLKILRDRTEQHLASQAVRGTADLLERMLENSSDFIMILELDARLVRASEGCQRLFGRGLRGFANAPWAELWSDGDRHKALAALDNARSGFTGRFQALVSAEPEQPRWMDVQVSPLLGLDGRPERLLCIARDDTGARRAGEERLRAAVQAIQGVVWTCNAHGEMEGEQRGWRALTGQEPDEYHGFGWARAVHAEDREAMLNAWYRAVIERHPFLHECRVRRADGSWGLFSISAAPRLEVDGRVREWIGVHTDISHHRSAQEALRLETRRLDILNRIGARLAAELDLDKLVQEATDAAVSLIGAQFGAFFYNVLNESGERYRLYALSGAPREAFAGFPMPRNTAVFSRTMLGEGLVRSDDITQDPRYGQSAPHQGMPPGHLPVRSYLAVPVISRSGEVLGGLLFGHEAPGMFTAEHEQLLTGIAGQAAIAIDNARLFRSAQQEVAQRKQAEALARQRSARLELLTEAIEKIPAARSLDELIDVIALAARRIAGADGVSVVLRERDQCFYAAESTMEPLWKGQCFPVTACVSGRAMLDRETLVVADVQDDERVSQDFYRGTFVRSLVMVPILGEEEALAAVGAYWAIERTPEAEEVATLEALARTAGAVIKRLEAERALHALNENLEAQVAERTADRERMWRLSTDVMLVARMDSRITAVNPAWTRQLGWHEGELLGRPFMDLVHPDDMSVTLAEVGRLAHGLTTLRFENRYRHRDGSYRWLSWIAVPEEDFIHAVGRDVTAEKEQAQALQQAESALRQAQKMEAVGQLTGGIAHDFNNLLTGIVGSLDLMQMRIAQGRTDALERYAKAAMSSANRAAALTHRLLAFARRQPLDPKPVDVNRLVGSMEDLLRRTLGETIEIELRVPDGVWLTLCDPNQLESALLNLAINARDAMPGGGRLTLATGNSLLDQAYAARHRQVRPGEYVCIAVADTGTGMPPEVIERAFEPFFTTKAIGHGTGLGLSMIYGFAQQSEGHARIHSTLGQGTTVQLYLPRFQGVAEDEMALSGLTDACRTDLGETVLVVEDEPVVRELVVEVLQDLGYQALEAADGLEGLRILESGCRVDLLVSDLGLPGLNGHQLASRARETRPELKVLFITGYAENATQAGGFLAPGMEMITKPFSIESMALRIRDMIES